MNSSGFLNIFYKFFAHLVNILTTEECLEVNCLLIISCRLKDLTKTGIFWPRANLFLFFSSDILSSAFSQRSFNCCDISELYSSPDIPLSSVRIVSNCWQISLPFLVVFSRIALELTPTDGCSWFISCWYGFYWVIQNKC